MDNTQRRDGDSSSSSLGEKRRREFSKSYSAAPFIVYRSAKYSSLRSRTLDYVTNAKAVFKHPTLQKWVSKLVSLLYDVAVGFLLIACFPVVLVSFCAIQLFRKLQRILVKKYYPGVRICDDFNARQSPPSAVELDIVNSLIWVKGSLDLDTIKIGIESRINAPFSPLKLLGRALLPHFRLLVWGREDLSPQFKIDDHVSFAPSKFHGLPITDEPLREISGASVLQKYVTYIMSSSLQSTSKSPWAINIIPLPSGKQSTTTLVLLRFHRLLLKEKAVVAMFLSSLGQKGTFEVELSESGQDQFIPCELGGSRIEDHKMEENTSKYSEGDEKCWKNKSRLFWESMSQGIESFILDVDSWITLRQRQAEFHSRLALGKIMLAELSENVAIKSVQISKGFTFMKQLTFEFLQILRAIFYCPKILFRICFTNRSPTRTGLYRKNGEMSKTVSWSKQLPTQFLQEICSKMENSEAESVVFLTAVSLALKDYYQENCIQNPITVGASISSSSSPYEQKLVQLPTRMCEISKELNNLEEQIHSFSSWKQLALSYLIKFSTFFLPQCVAYSLVVKKLANYYPIHLTLVDTHSSFPHLTFWGHPVQEFTFWRHPQSNLCISVTLVKYGGQFRLTVSSPMKSVDSFISQRFPQYLNQIAESVGLDRERIPYSRKSSPLSSNASSRGDEDEETLKSSIFNSIQVSSRIKKTKLVKRFNSCQNLRY